MEHLSSRQKALLLKICTGCESIVFSVYLHRSLGFYMKLLCCEGLNEDGERCLERSTEGKVELMPVRLLAESKQYVPSKKPGMVMRSPYAKVHQGIQGIRRFAHEAQHQA